MSAIQQLLTDHIDIWTAAETEKRSGRGRASGNAASVYGIKKLRELILDLAVRGKLVPQDANDESASELFNSIQAEKEKLIAAGIIKKGKPLAEIAEEGLFALPEKWLWVRLGDVCSYIQRGKGPDYVENSDFTVISQKCVRWTGLDLTQARSIDPKSFSKYESIRVLREGDILWNSTGTGTIGRACLVPQLEKQQILIADSHVTVVRMIGFLGAYLWRWIQSPSVQSKIEGVASGTTNQIELNTSTVISHPLPLPPLNEQHRIVAKVDELMALCDQLEAQHSDAADAHEKLVSNLLGTLTQSQCAADFNANWQRIAAHFDTMFTTEASIDALKKTLLQLAVMGKLVAQDANDEPASELLKRIKTEKTLLLAEKKIKRESPLPPINQDDFPFALPKGWLSVQMADICFQITDGTHQTPKYVPTGRPFLSAQNVKPFRFIPTDYRFVSQDDFDSLRKNRTPEKGDILLTRVGAMIGEAAVIDIDFEFAFYVSLGLLKPSKQNIDSDFIVLWLNSPIGTSTSIKNTLGRGVSAGNLNLSLIRNFLIGLPPLHEQHRIVAKANELMNMCDKLRSSITDANQQQKKLADGFVKKAVEA